MPLLKPSLRTGFKATALVTRKIHIYVLTEKWMHSFQSVFSGKNTNAEWFYYSFCIFLNFTVNILFFTGIPALANQTSLSEAADAILGSHSEDHRGGNIHQGNTGSGSERFDSSPGAVAKSLLGKFTMRKASILSISSIGSFNADRKSNSSTEELYPNSNKSKFF